jgi:hypothetical protein
MDMQKIEQEDGTIAVTLDGKPLKCPVCGNEGYQERASLLNSRGGEFFGLAWAEDNATNFVCAKCGYVYWFLW